MQTLIILRAENSITRIVYYNLTGQPLGRDGNGHHSQERNGYYTCG
jgi:hypothetical protein